MRRCSIIFWIIFCSNFTIITYGQNFGYRGKKNYLDVKVLAHLPIVANRVYSITNSNGYFGAGPYGPVVAGVYLNLGRTFRQNRGASLEFGFDHFSFNEPNLYFNRIQCYSIMPKIELTNKFQLLPLGISHQIGLGYYFIKSSNVYAPGSITVDNGISIMYAIQMRTAISKSIFLTYGTRYCYSQTFSPFDSYDDEKFQRTLNLLRIEGGLTFVF